MYCRERERERERERQRQRDTDRTESLFFGCTCLAYSPVPPSLPPFVPCSLSLFLVSSGGLSLESGASGLELVGWLRGVSWGQKKTNKSADSWGAEEKHGFA